MKKFLASVLSFTMLVTFTACGDTKDSPAEVSGKNGEGATLTIYSNSVTDGRGEWLQERASQDGFSIQFVDANAADVQNRLIAEAAAPIADVAFGLNTILWESLKAENVLAQYVPEWANEVSEGLNDPDGYYHATVKQAILLAYDTNQVKPEDAPTDWLDLFTNEKFYGTYEYLTSLGGGTVRNVLAGILTRYADPNGELGVSDAGWKAIEQYYAHGIPSESGVDLYAQIASDTSPVVCGQMWSSGIASRDAQYGTKTGYAVPAVGVPYAVESVAIINGTKNLEEAQRFVDWFGSAKIQGEWAQAFSTLPANKNAVNMADEFNQEIAKIPAQDIDWALVSENIDAWCEKITLEYMP